MNPNRPQSSPNITDEERVKQSHMFSNEWMNKAYRKVALPNPACEKVLGKVNDALARRLRKPTGTPAQQQALFMLLGHKFVKDHYPDRKIDPTVLEGLPRDEKEKIMRQTTEFLDKETQAAIDDIGMPKSFAEYNENDDLGHYVREVRSTFRNGLDEEVQKQVENFGKKQTGSLKGKVVTPEQCRNTIVGQTLLSLMDFNPSLASDIENDYKSKVNMMPNPLRQKIYMEHMFQKELKALLRKPVNEINDDLLKQQKGIVQAKMKDQNIERPTRSNAAKNIYKLVYKEAPGLKALQSDDEHKFQASKVLNIIHVLNKKVQTSQVFFLCPLQLAFGKLLEEENDDDMLKLSLLLDLACEHVKPNPVKLFGYADEVLALLKTEDPEYYKKLMEVIKLKIKPTANDFPDECLNQKQLQAEKLYNDIAESSASGTLPQHLEPILGDPAIFLRKWLVQGFAGVLNTNGLMLTWDHLFLNKCSDKIFVNTTLAILKLIKPWMMHAKSYTGVRKVFLEEPANLYTTDLRKAYQHLQKTPGVLSGFPPNTNYIEGPVQERAPTPVRTPSPPPRLIPFGPALPPFDVHIDLDSDEEPPREPTPPPPKPPTPPPREPTPPPPPKAPTPPPRAPTPPAMTHWVPYSKSFGDKKTPKPTIIQKPFDLYIDGLRFLPDNIALAKVTGRFFNVKDEEGPSRQVQDINALPIAESPHRTPKIKHRTTVNKEGIIINPFVTCMLKAYGYQTHTKEVVHLGSCILGIFEEVDRKPMLRTGGHQMRLKRGDPQVNGGPENLTADDMDENPSVPGLTLLLRLLPHEEEEVSAPEYEKGFYKSLPCKPNKSELTLYNYYASTPDFKASVGDKAREIQKLTGAATTPDGPELKKWLTNALANKNKPVDIQRFVKYDQKTGLSVVVQQAFCLAEYHEFRYAQAFVQIVYENEIDQLLKACQPETRCLTSKLESLSPYRYPKWLDQPKILKPKFEENALMIIRIMGFPVAYTPGKGGPGKGTVSNRTSGKALELKLELCLAWTVIPLFSKKCLIQGEYSLPLFKAPIPADILKECVDSFPDFNQVLVKHVKDKASPLKDHNGASLDMAVWDGRFQVNEAPEIDIREWMQSYEKQIEDGVYLQTHHQLLTALGKETQAENQRSFTALKKAGTYHQIVLENLDPKTKSAGPKGDTFEQEKDKFFSECDKEFKRAFNEALSKAGQKPL